MARELAEPVTRAGFQVFFDVDAVAPGENFARVIGKALDQASAMIGLLSPDATKSEWVRWEIEHALTQRRCKDRLISVMTRRTEDFPWILRQLQLIDATGDRKGAGKRVVDALERADRDPGYRADPDQGAVVALALRSGRARPGSRRR